MVEMSSKSEVFEFSGGRNPLLGELHLTYDAHFRTWRSYCSEKSCVKIWCGLVEIGGMLMFSGGPGGGEKPPISGVTFKLRCQFSYTTEIF